MAMLLHATAGIDDGTGGDPAPDVAASRISGARNSRDFPGTKMLPQRAAWLQPTMMQFDHQGRHDRHEFVIAATPCP